MKVKMYTPKTGAEILVNPQQVEHYKRIGFTETAPGKSPAPKKGGNEKADD